jgi:hypothetical protein
MDSARTDRISGVYYALDFRASSKTLIEVLGALHRVSRYFTHISIGIAVGL